MIKCQLNMFASLIISGGKSSQRRKKAFAFRKKNTSLPLEKDLDTRLISPNSKGKIGIETIRDLKKWLQHKPRQASQKIAIIQKAEALTPAAQNAFLKTLEEPPSHSLIILTTANYHLLLPTIISRCHLIKLKPPSFSSSSFHSAFFLSLSQKISFVQKFRHHPEELSSWLRQERKYWQGIIKKDPHRALALLRKITHAEKMALSFVSPILVAHWLLTASPSLKKESSF